MNIPISRRALCLAFLLAALGGCSESRREAAGETGVDALPRYVVGVDRDFPPYSFVDSKGRISGYTVDLTRAVAEVMGIEIELRAGTNDEIVAGLERGEIDIVPHLSATEKLEETLAFTLPHLEASDAIFVRQETTSVLTEAHIHDLPTLVWQADAVAEELRANQIAEEILDEASIAETLRRLATGEGDCALVPYLTGLELVADLKLANLRLAGPPIQSYTRSLSFGVKLADRELLEALEEGLTLVTTTDRYPQIYNAWFGVRERTLPREVLVSWMLWISVPLLAVVALAVAWNASLRRTVARRTAALRESEERLQGILDNAPMMVYMKDADGRYLVVNRQFEKLAGRHRGQVQDATDSELFDPPQVAQLRANDARVLETGEVYACEEIFPTADGRRTLRSVRFPLHHADGSVYAVCAINADVTEQKQAEEEKRNLEAQMQQTQKLESLGVLAGGIAHDFNNLLMGILGNAQMALLDVDDGSSLRPQLRDIESAGQRAAELCQQMLAYSGRGKFVVEPLDLSRLVADMTHLLEVSMSKKSSLGLHFADDLPAFEADAVQIRQVVINLITNAAEALGDEAGTITVRTGVKACDRAYLKKTFLAEDLDAGDYVFLEVSDTGGGMDAETRERIFDPFFSTKFTGRGLGLAATLGIVRGHRGALEVESAPGEGTVVRVLFPASDKPRPSTIAAATLAAGIDDAGGQGTILVVDDEAIVLTITRRVLERAGYQVLTAGDGREGFEVFRRHASDISLVLLDVTMPRMSGDETFRKMRRLRDDVRVLVSSGYNERDATSELTGLGPAGFIQKPYAPTALLRKVREAIH